MGGNHVTRGGKKLEGLKTAGLRAQEKEMTSPESKTTKQRRRKGEGSTDRNWSEKT